MPVKGNQLGLQADIERCLARAADTLTATGRGAVLGLAHHRVQACGDRTLRLALRTAYSYELGHGRVERRSLEVVTVPATVTWLAWPGRQQVFCVSRETHFKKSGRKRRERVYGITSLTASQADAATLLTMVRSHWGIENKLHWVRDVTFDEDRSRARSGHLPQVLAAIRNTAIGLLRCSGAKNIAAACRACAAQPWQALNLIGIQRTE